MDTGAHDTVERWSENLDLAGEVSHDLHVDPTAVSFYLAHDRLGAPGALHDGDGWWPLGLEYWTTPDGALLGLSRAVILGDPCATASDAFAKARRLLLQSWAR